MKVKWYRSEIWRSQQAVERGADVPESAECEIAIADLPVPVRALLVYDGVYPVSMEMCWGSSAQCVGLHGCSWHGVGYSNDPECVISCGDWDSDTLTAEEFGKWLFRIDQARARKEYEKEAATARLLAEEDARIAAVEAAILADYRAGKLYRRNAAGQIERV
jgi:hypothetical protein